MNRLFSDKNPTSSCGRPKCFRQGRLMLTAKLICFVAMGLVGLTHNASAQEASVFTGSSPPVANSDGTLVLNDDLQNENTFQWQSLDSILGEIDTESVTATRWVYLPGFPDRLVFVGNGDGATIYGNVIFGDYNRAVVDIVKGSKRVRYLLIGVTGEVAWVDDNFNEPDFVPTLSGEDTEPFDHDPGEPGGPGGFGGPPAGSGITALADPFRIENLEVSDEGDIAPATMTLALTSNVASWTQAFVLTETSADSNIFVDADDSLAIQVIEYSSHMFETIDTMQLFAVSMAFGARRSMIVFETGADTDIFASQHLEIVMTMTELPDPGTVDIITATLSSNLELDIVINTLIETGDDTLVFESSDGSFCVIIDRITANGFAAKDDVTAFVTSDLLKVKDAEIDVIETGPDTLEFRTDALCNENGPGNGPGALSGLAIGSKWEAALKIKESDPWPFAKHEVKVAVRRRRGASTVGPTKVYFLKWRRDKFITKGGLRYHPLFKGDNTRVYFLLVKEDIPFCVRDGGNLKAPVQPGDSLIASPWGKESPKDAIVVFGVKFEKSALCSGFDDTIDPPWLIVPQSGTNTAKAIIAPSTFVAKVDFESGNKNKATISPTKASMSPQTITVTGVAKGETNVKAKIDNSVAGTLNISVKERKTVKVALHYMKDNAGHSTTRSKADAQSFIDKMNAIWKSQANIVFTKFAVDEPTVLKDLGDVVEWYAAPALNEWDDVVAFGVAGADLNIFFVWEYEQDGTPSTDNADAAELSGNILFEDNAGSEVGETMAHEAGHFLNVSPSDYTDASRKDELMYKFTDVRGCKILKAQADQANNL